MPGGAVTEREVLDTPLRAGAKALNAAAPRQKLSNDDYSDKVNAECLCETLQARGELPASRVRVTTARIMMAVSVRLLMLLR